MEMQVHAYLSGTLGPQTSAPPPPPPPMPPPEIFLMCAISHLNALMRNTQRALLRCHRCQTLVVSLSCKATAWVRAMLAAWKPHMLSFREKFRASCLQVDYLPKLTWPGRCSHITLSHWPMRRSCRFSPPWWGFTSCKCAP